MALELTTSSPDAQVRLRVTAPTQLLVVDARLAAAGAPPCRAGIETAAIALDRQRRWDRPLGMAGTHELVLTFVDGAVLLDDDAAVVDLEIAGGSGPTCLRLPVTGEVALRPAPRWSVGGVVRGAFPARVAPFALWEDSLRVTYWTRALALAFEGGWGWSSCSGCPRAGGVDVPLSITVEALPFRRRGIGLGVGIAYGVSYVHAERASDSELWLHGPRVALHLLELTPIVHASPMFAVGKGFELSLGYQWTSGGAFPATLLVGLGIVAF